MKESLTAQEDIGISVKPRGSSTSIASPGSTSAAGKVNGSRELAKTNPLASLQPSQAQDILSKMRSVRPWRIKLEEQKDVKTALPLLELALIPATYEDCAYWIGRLLAHFPRRDTTKDGIVIADLAGDLTEDRIPHAALIAVCDELRRESTEQKPWMPPTGEIILRCNDVAHRWEKAQKYLSQNWEEVKAKREIEKDIQHSYDSVRFSDKKMTTRRAKAAAILRDKPFDTWTKWEKKFFVAFGRYTRAMEEAMKQNRVEKYGHIIPETEVPF